MFGMNDASEFAILLVLLPLLPAVLIFLIFPKTEMVAQGPLQGLTIRAGGAFGAYLVVLLVLMAWMKFTDLDKVARSWTFVADVIVKDKNGRPIDPRALDKDAFSVSYTPTYIRPIPEQDRFNIKIIATELEGDIPAMTITYANVGNTTINPDRPKIAAARDDLRNKYVLTEPLTIDPVVSEGFGDTSPGN